MTSVFEVYLAVLPKGGPEADDRDINLKPSARSGRSPPPSAPCGHSSMFCGSSAISLYLFVIRPRPSKFSNPCRLRTARQLLPRVCVPRRNDTRQRATRTSTSSLPPEALPNLYRPVTTRQPLLWVLVQEKTKRAQERQRLSAGSPYWLL
jgi:hypothetical protein